jgi:hypothetical protein
MLGFFVVLHVKFSKYFASPRTVSVGVCRQSVIPGHIHVRAKMAMDRFHLLSHDAEIEQLSELHKAWVIQQERVRNKHKCKSLRRGDWVYGNNMA